MGGYVAGGLIISALSGLFFCVGEAMPYLPQMVLWGKLAAILYFPQAKLG